jgi:hypothetical protein
MKNPLPANIPAQLARGRRCLERWRRTHKPHTKLPESLWSLSAELAREYGLNRTARTLRLDYNGLKKRLNIPVSNGSSSALSHRVYPRRFSSNPMAHGSSAALSACRPAGRAPIFLELPSAGMPSAVECLLECEDGRGARIRIHLKGGELPDLAALSRGLWSPDR